MPEQSRILQTYETRLGARTVTVEEWVPRLEPQEYDEKLRAIEGGLYDIFIQYEDKTAGP